MAIWISLVLLGAAERGSPFPEAALDIDDFRRRGGVCQTILECSRVLWGITLSPVELGISEGDTSCASSTAADGDLQTARMTSVERRGMIASNVIASMPMSVPNMPVKSPASCVYRHRHDTRVHRGFSRRRASQRELGYQSVGRADPSLLQTKRFESKGDRGYCISRLNLPHIASGRSCATKIVLFQWHIVFGHVLTTFN
jgi:hypothetical protein